KPMTSTIPGSVRKSVRRSRTERESSTRNTRSGTSEPITFEVRGSVTFSPFAPTASPSRWLLLDKSILDGVVGEVGIGFRAHLFHDARPVRAHRLVAEKELFRDRPYRVARRQLEKN